MNQKTHKALFIWILYLQLLATFKGKSKCKLLHGAKSQEVGTGEGIAEGSTTKILILKSEESRIGTSLVDKREIKIHHLKPQR